MWFLAAVAGLTILMVGVYRALARHDREVDSYYEREYRDPPSIGFISGGGFGGG